MARPLDKGESDDLKKRLPDSIARNWGIVGRIARDLGVRYDTISHILDNDEDLADLARQAKANTVDAVVARLYETAIQPGLVTKADVAPVLFFLKAVGGFSETQRIEHGGRVEYSPPPGAVKTDSESPDAADGPPLLSLLKSAGNGSNGTP